MSLVRMAIVALTPDKRGNLTTHVIRWVKRFVPIVHTQVTVGGGTSIVCKSFDYITLFSIVACLRP